MKEAWLIGNLVVSFDLLENIFLDFINGVSSKFEKKYVEDAFSKYYYYFYIFIIYQLEGSFDHIQ